MALLHVTFLFLHVTRFRLKAFEPYKNAARPYHKTLQSKKKREGSHPCEPISPITLFHVKEIMFFVVFYFYYLRSV